MKNKIFSENILKLRKKAKLSQKQLAEKVGIINTQIGNIERGESLPSMELLLKLVDFFERSLDELVGRTPPNNQ